MPCKKRQRVHCPTAGRSRAPPNASLWVLRRRRSSPAIGGVALASLAKAADNQIIVGLITKTEVNPYFVKLCEAIG